MVAWLLVLALVMTAILFLFTDEAPLVEQPAPPGAEQASAVRQAVSQLRGQGSGNARAVQLRFTSTQLAAAGALASDGLQPDRLLIELDGNRINIVGSHRLFFGRWLNAGLVSEGSKKGFPPVHLTVGSVSFSPGISRRLLEAARWMVNRRGANIPPLDELIQYAEVRNDEALATVRLPKRSGLIDQLAGGRGAIDRRDVSKAYCTLARLHAATPTDDLAQAVRRAFPADRAAAASAASNRAAFVALAMLAVSPRVGELAGLSGDDIEGCAIAPVEFQLHGRADLAKHWALSAALEVTTGAGIGQAMGEWKELSDSVSKQSEFAVGDPSGFSFVDLAADRSGLSIARAAIDPARARSIAARLATITQHELLPPRLMRLEEGLPEHVFAENYGTIRDERFIARLRQIDKELDLSAAP